VALKEISDKTTDIVEVFDMFYQEITIMGTLAHPNIVSMKAFSFSPFTVVMEFIPKFNLYDWLQSKPQITWPLRMKIVSDIANALYYMHSFTPSIVHRDLKSPNILIVGENPEAEAVAKVTDFGTSGKLYSVFKGQSPNERLVENPTWLAPEVVRGDHYDARVDVYAFGIILWEVISSDHPFDEYQFRFHSEIEEAILFGKRPTIPQDCLPEYQSLIETCWNQDPKKRPTFKEIVEVLLPVILKDKAPTIHIKKISSNTVLKIQSKPKNEIEVGGIQYTKEELEKLLLKNQQRKMEVTRTLTEKKNNTKKIIDILTEKETYLKTREEELVKLEEQLKLLKQKSEQWKETEESNNRIRERLIKFQIALREKDAKLREMELAYQSREEKLREKVSTLKLR